MEEVDLEDIASIDFACSKLKHRVLMGTNLLSGFQKWTIMPGTKWCGMGSIASNYSDLGQEVAADICCRAHDHCLDQIHTGATSGNFTNTYSHTLSHCDCDDKFMQCLMRSEDQTADVVGRVFFNIVGAKCFTREEIRSCKRWRLWFCMEY
ncbi:Phospholipase A2, group III, partial [Cichlidogyrus casuarinus]